jgi:hypothetical protein
MGFYLEHLSNLVICPRVHQRLQMSNGIISSYSHSCHCFLEKNKKHSLTVQAKPSKVKKIISQKQAENMGLPMRIPNR